MNILMAAAENGGLDGGKVGGIGDVIRDVPPAIAARNCDVKVVTPSYGFLHKPAGSRHISSVFFSFAGHDHRTEIYEVQGKAPCHHVKHFVVDHPFFSSYCNRRGSYRIYVNDPPERPFATDAAKYALFCMALTKAVVQNLFGHLDCIHLHDWHTAFFLILRRFHEDRAVLKKIRTVYTIHNLALQGIRPFQGTDSSLEAWFPNLKYCRSDITDPRWTDCINPMAAGIRLADRVHTVSPSYAEEILNPSDKAGCYGGEGLEADLRSARKEGRFYGILNGCDYPQKRAAAGLDFFGLLKFLKSKLVNWAGTGETLSSSHFVAYARLTALGSLSCRPDMIVTSVSRVAEQKIFLMQAPGSRFESGLKGILESLGDQGIYILLGTGDKQYEHFLTQMSSRFENFIFMNGYSDNCASSLYATGDLFLMPSSFEPCGISQMLAMRDGQPCLVHEVGGLKDTVKNDYNGFSFTGEMVEAKVDNFVQSFINAVRLKKNDPDKWRQICRNAFAARFLWEDTVRQYLKLLYQ